MKFSELLNLMLGISIMAAMGMVTWAVLIWAFRMVTE